MNRLKGKKYDPKIQEKHEKITFTSKINSSETKREPKTYSKQHFLTVKLFKITNKSSGQFAQLLVSACRPKGLRFNYQSRAPTSLAFSIASPRLGICRRQPSQYVSLTLIPLSFSFSLSSLPFFLPSQYDIVNYFT